MESHGVEGEIQVTESTYNLLTRISHSEMIPLTESQI